MAVKLEFVIFRLIRQILNVYKILLDLSYKWSMFVFADNAEYANSLIRLYVLRSASFRLTFSPVRCIMRCTRSQLREAFEKAVKSSSHVAHGGKTIYQVETPVGVRSADCIFIRYDVSNKSVSLVARLVDSIPLVIYPEIPTSSEVVLARSYPLRSETSAWRLICSL